MKAIEDASLLSQIAKKARLWIPNCRKRRAGKSGARLDRADGELTIRRLHSALGHSPANLAESRNLRRPRYEFRRSPTNAIKSSATAAAAAFSNSLP